MFSNNTPLFDSTILNVFKTTQLTKNYNKILDIGFRADQIDPIKSIEFSGNFLFLFSLICYDLTIFMTISTIRYKYKIQIQLSATGT